MKHQAIRNTHASVVTIRDDKGYDSSDNEVSLDDAAVATELTRLETVYASNVTATATNKTSGRDKLVTLGLTTDELDALGIN